MQVNNLHGDAKESMDDIFHALKIPHFKKKLVLDGISQTNHHLLIPNKHGSHVTLKVIEQVEDFSLDMVTFPSHTSHAFQLLNVLLQTIQYCINLFLKKIQNHGYKQLF
jgi:hypothetical protein